MNCHNLLFLMMLVKQHDLPEEALNVFLFSSQPCESTFRNARALSGIYRSAVNFSMTDFLHRSEKLAILNELKYSQEWSNYEQIIQFPIHHKKKTNRDNLADANDIYTMNFEKIILAAFEHAKQLVDNLGILNVLQKYNALELDELSSKTRDSIKVNMISNSCFLNDFGSTTNYESDYESDTDTSTENEDETSECYEMINDLVVQDEDLDDLNTSSQNELTANRINFSGMRIFDDIKPTMKN